MANHKSSLKRIRQEEKRRLHNRYYAKQCVTLLKNFVQLLTSRSCCNVSGRSEDVGQAC